jgi:hypothetical protein
MSLYLPICVPIGVTVWWCGFFAVVAGLTHGAGTIPGANIGKHGALFEQGPRHAARDIAGKDLVNPTGIRRVGLVW